MVLFCLRQRLICVPMRDARFYLCREIKELCGSGRALLPSPMQNVEFLAGTGQSLESKMPHTRLNITLPTDVVDDIKSLYGPRGISQFLEEAAREKLSDLKKKAYKGLIEGYRATAEETVEVLKKFEAVVTEKRDV